MLRPRHLCRRPTHLYIHLKVSLSKKFHLSGSPPRGAEGLADPLNSLAEGMGRLAVADADRQLVALLLQLSAL